MRASLIGIWCCLIFAPLIHAEQAHRGRLPDSITPFVANTSHIIVHLKLKSRELHFLVDTGSSWSIIDATHSDLVGDRMESRLVRSNENETLINFFQCEGIRFLDDVELCTKPLGVRDLGLKHQFPVNVDGILGMDALKDWCVQFNFDLRALLWWKGVPADVEFLGTKTQSEVDAASGSPLVACDCGDFRQMKCRVATGSTMSVGFLGTDFERALHQGNLRLTNEIEFARPDGQNTYKVGRVASFYCGGRSIPVVVGCLPKQATEPTIGLPLLERYNTTFVFPRNMIYWVVREARCKKGDYTDNDGITVTKAAEGLVLRVFEDSPAYVAGARTGDILKAIDNYPVESLPPFSVSRALMTTRVDQLRLTLWRDKESVECILNRRSP